MSVRRALRALVLVAAVLGLLAVVSPAGAATSCGRAVIDDWYDDGRVDGTYALSCYDAAIDILPRDVRVYSSAEEDIRRALAAARRGEDAPPARTDPTPGDGPTTPPQDPGDPGDPGDPENTSTETTSTPPPDDQVPPTDEIAGSPIDTDSESASSIPIPLLILAGLALLLVAGGLAGYLIRRNQARSATPPAI